MYEVIVDIGDIALQTLVKATMHNATKTSMHNPMQKPQTSNLINKIIWNVWGQGSILRNVGNI